MAQKIQAWTAYGPRIDLGQPMTEEEFIENIVAATNQSKGSVLAVLAEFGCIVGSGPEIRPHRVTAKRHAL